MFFFKFIQGLSISSFVLASSLILNVYPSFGQSDDSNQIKFFCGQTFDRASQQTIPATLVWVPQSREHLRIISWKSNYFPPNTMTAEERCQIVSTKFQIKYEKGELNYLTFGENNGYPILCGVSNVDDPCDGNSQLFTLPYHPDPKVTLKRLSDMFFPQTRDFLMKSSSNFSYISLDELINYLPVK